MQTSDFSPSITEGKIPPNAVEAEMQILGTILLDNRVLDEVRSRLRPEHFYYQSHATVYQCMLELSAREQPVDLITTEQWLVDRSLLKDSRKNLLSTLFDVSTTWASVDGVVELIRERSNRRKALDVARDIQKAAYDMSTPFEELIQSIQQSVFELSGVAERTNTTASLNELMINLSAEIEKRYETGEQVGIKSGFYDLDDMTGGFQNGDLIIPAGRPGAGKTSWTLNFARNAAMMGHSGMMFSLEMSKEQLAYRMLATESDIESGRIKAAQIANQEWIKLANGQAILSGLPIVFDDSPNPSVSDIRSKCLSVASRLGRLDWVAIDYLQLMQGDSGNRVTDLGNITRSLKQLARTLDCPVLCLSQLNRGVESRTNKRPVTSDLRESGSIEQDADVIMMFYRDEYYNPDTPDRGIAEIIVTKQRNGPVGTVKTLFDARLTEFKNMAER